MPGILPHAKYIHFVVVNPGSHLFLLLQAFHGNVVSVYTKSEDSRHGITDIKWTRHVLEV